VFILLPPSEAKVVGGDGPAFQFDGQLAATRRVVLREVAALCTKAAGAKGATAKSVIAAAAALSLPPGEVAESCQRNAEIFSASTLPALDRYNGVVYQGLAAGSLKAAARRVADRSVLIFSGGLGVVAGDELVPWYRIPASARLPKAGTVASLWRKTLAATIPSIVGDEFVVDLRSSDYAGLWRPIPGAVLAVRVLQRRPSGSGEQVVSFHSKLVKGQLTRAIVEAAARKPVDDASSVADIASRLGLDVRTTAAGLDLVDPDPTPFGARS
jgi:cytoplasmic iron level regulating protein YaaA (DUF328/UPF0246 family)